MKTFLILFFLTSNIYAGDKGGNGGGTQHCPNRFENRAQFYDLKEITVHLSVTRRRQIQPYDGFSSKRDHFNRAIEKVKKLSAKLADAIVRANDFYQANVKNNDNFKLELVHDADIYSIDQDCEYKQLVNWIEPEQMLAAFGVYETHILRDNLIYESLNPLHQAASDFHEAAYRVRRAFGLDNNSGSNFVRLFTGQVFSEGEIDKDLITQIALYDKKQIAGFEVLFTSKVCTEIPVWKITNNGARVLKQYSGEPGSWYTSFQLKAGETKTLKRNTLSLSLDQGGVFANFRKSVNIPLLFEITVCGEEFLINKTLLADEEKTDINIRVISSPL